VNELTITYRDQHVVLQPGHVAMIGRLEGSALVISDPRVSREHIRLSWGPQGWVLENVGRTGTFVYGQPVTQFNLTRPVEVQLAAVDGPTVRLDPAAVPAVPGPAVPGPGAPGLGAPGPAAPWAGGYPPAPGYAPAPAPGYPPGPAYPPGPIYPPPQPQPMPGGHAQPAGAGGVGGSGPGGKASAGDATSALRMLIPIRAWVTDPTLRQWPKLLVAVYALLPVIALVPLQNSADLKTIGWVYSLYIAPLWALVFWWLIRPGPIHRLHVAIAAVIIAAEYILVPALTIPWEKALAPTDSSHNLLSWITGVGLAEEITKALPVLILAIFLLKVRHIKLDVRMWMFLATLSGLFFGVYEASTVYVPHDLEAINPNTVFGVPALMERVFVDGLQHALWAGVAGFFIGLGINYRRRRYLLWLLGIAIPAVLHGLNDWSSSGVFGSSLWPWIIIQAFSVFLFLGYASSAHAIEEEVRLTPIFRHGDSMLIELSQLQKPSGEG
jgi:RsiW-degrading membrane proteinase PrsW (M82 family)